MKPGELVVIIDSVEEAVKFYTEKLSFDISDLRKSHEDKTSLAYVRLKKGKCFLIFRKPRIEELAEFSYIKRCVGRSIGLTIEIKNSIHKLFERYKKKGIKIVRTLTHDDITNVDSFVISDPFGIKITFIQPAEKPVVPASLHFFDLTLNQQERADINRAETIHLDRMIEQLKNYKVLRRAAKKFAKTQLKEMIK